MTHSAPNLADTAIAVYDEHGELALIAFIARNLDQSASPVTWNESGVAVLSEDAVIVVNLPNYEFRAQERISIRPVTFEIQDRKIPEANRGALFDEPTAGKLWRQVEYHLKDRIDDPAIEHMHLDYDDAISDFLGRYPDLQQAFNDRARRATPPSSLDDSHDVILDARATAIIKSMDQNTLDDVSHALRDLLISQGQSRPDPPQRATR